VYLDGTEDLSVKDIKILTYICLINGLSVEILEGELNLKTICKKYLMLELIMHI